MASLPYAAARGTAASNATNNNNKNDDDNLMDALEQILGAEANRRIKASSPQAYMNGSAALSEAGPLEPSELQLLSLLCTSSILRQRKKPPPGGNKKNKNGKEIHSGFASVDGDLLTTLMELLEKHVNIAVGVDLIQEAMDVIQKREMKMDQWLAQNARIEGLRRGLEAAAILLFIVTSPGIELRLVSEDAIKACFTLLRHNLVKNIVPALNNTGHLLVNTEEKKGTASARKKRRRSSEGTEGSADVIRDLKKVYKYVASMLQLQLVLMERVESAVQTVFMDDQQIMTLASGALKALEIEAPVNSQNLANRLQTSTISLVTAVFRKFPMHRYSIVEDLIPLLLKIPTSKKFQRAFNVRYTSCMSPEKTKSLTKSICGPEPHYIQMMTATVISLVQCCIVRPTLGAPAGDQGEEAQLEERTSNQFVSGLRGCREIADSFADQLLQRCSKKGEDGGASEFRPVLNSIIEDLLMVMLIPEYAASQLILLYLTHRLSKDLLDASQHTNAQNSETGVEATYVNTAFDSLGRICATYAKILAIHREKDLYTKVTILPPDHDETRCYCKRTDDEDMLRVDCDHCHAYFHAKCVGLSRDLLPKKWLCDACSLQKVSAAEKADLGLNEQAIEGMIDTKFILNKVVMRHLQQYPEFQGAACYHLAMWAGELDYQTRNEKSGNAPSGDRARQQLISSILEQWNSRSGISNRKGVNRVFSEEGGMRVLLHLKSTNSQFKNSFENLMLLVVKLMSNKAHASLRKLSIKAIEKVVESDPMLMMLSKVYNPVSERLADESISVREAVVSLVGSYVVSSPILANAFHSQLLPRLLDPGVSVRKRAVKILEEILLTNPHYKERSDACNALLQRAVDPKEDDGVREALHTLFMKLWLEDGGAVMPAAMELGSPIRNGDISSPASRSPAAGSLVQELTFADGRVTPTPPPVEARITRVAHSKKARSRSDLAAASMVQTVKVAGSNQNLSSFMKELLCNVNDADKGKKAAERVKRQKVAEKECFNLSDALFELLLTTEENRAELGETIGAELVATIRTIGVFAEVSPSSVLKHLETILPYLKGDNGLKPAEESSIASAAADILYRVTPILDETALEKLSSGTLGGDLVKISYQYGSIALFSSIRALCTLAHHPDAGEASIFGKKLTTLAKTSYAYLYKKHSDSEFSDPNVKNNVLRLHSALGSICRFHEVPVDAATWNDEVVADEIEVFSTAEVTWGNVPLASFRLLSKYLEKDDVEVKCSSLRAISGIFVQHPRLMLASAQSGLIEDVMSKAAPIELQMEALRCWRDISMAEANRIDSGEAKKKMDSKATITTSKKISGDQDGDSTVVGGVLTKQCPRLFEMTQDKESGLRIASLELLGELLRQGLVNPNEAVPYLLALQGDVENTQVRSKALSLLISEGEKRPDTLRQRVCAGVKQACRFQCQVYDSSEASALVKKRKGNRFVTECVFDDVFRECIISSQKQREGLYRNLINMFERVEPTGNPTSSAKKARSRRSSILETPEDGIDTPLLSFAAQVLAYLPYTSIGDPLFIQHHITNIIALQGPLMQDKLADFLRPHGLASSDELDETNVDEDALERAAKTKAPARCQLAAPLSGDNFDWPTFVDLCKQASSLALLLRLKKFLIERYNLSTQKCLEYNPESKSKERGRGGFIGQKDVGPFNASILTASGDKSRRGDDDMVIKHYAWFRELMRDESKHGDVDINVDSDVEPMPLDGASDSEAEPVEGVEDDEAVVTNKKRRRSSSAKKKRKRKST